MALNKPLLTKFSKSVFSGGLSALVYLILAFVLTELFEVWYLASTVAAFLLAGMLNFVLQKMWVFSEKSLERSRYQLPSFIIVVILNLLITTAGIYILVGIMGVRHIFAQVLVLGVLAGINFMIFTLIFRTEKGGEGS